MGIFKQTKEDTKTAKKNNTKKADPKKAEAKKTANKKSASMKDLYDSKTTTKKTTSKKSDAKKVAKNGNAYKVLVKPLITEKAASMSAEGKYAFEVSVDANKIEIADAIEEVYGLRPKSVNVINMLGKKVRFGRTMGRRKDWKKAIVTLGKGETINIYEGV